MESLNNTPAPVTPVELLKRQLSDWRELHAQLCAENEATPTHERYTHIQYCAALIDNIEADLVMLTGTID